MSSAQSGPGALLPDERLRDAPNPFLKKPGIKANECEDDNLANRWYKPERVITHELTRAMNRKTIITLSALGGLALCLCSCATSSIKQSWKSPAYQGGAVAKVSVLAVDPRDFVRNTVENLFVRELRWRGQHAIATHDLLGLREIKADKQAAVSRVRAAGADAVLIIRLVNQSTYSREVQATPAVYLPTVSGYEGYDWYDYFSVTFTDMGVVWGSTKQQVYLDSSLFDLKTGQRIWSALTLTVLQENMDRLEKVDALAVLVVKRLRKDGVIR